MKNVKSKLFLSLLFLVAMGTVNAITQKPFVIVIPSYNNADWYQKNLDSVFIQDYDNYRVIYLDDCSADNTCELVMQYVKACGQEDRVTIVHNQKRKGALYNHWYAVHMCDFDEIIINLDGDDWLADSQVLNVLNEIYQDPGVWMTYGSYQNYPSKKAGECSRPLPKAVIQRNAFREVSYITSHLRTFYAGLFKQIKLADFLYDGKFLMAACDMALMMPMLEMSGEHIRYIDNILYIYNQANQQSHLYGGVLRQLNMAHITRARKKYERLSEFPKPDMRGDDAVIILFADNPIKLQNALESIDTFVYGVTGTYVFYDFESEGQLSNLQNIFPHVVFIKTDEYLQKNLQQLLHSIAQDFVVCATDSCLVTDTIHLSDCIALLKKTHAFGFYLSLGNNITEYPKLNRKQTIPACVELDSDIYTWKLKDGEFNWKEVYNLNMTIYSKETITSCIENLSFNSGHSLQEMLYIYPYNTNDIGLFFNHSKVICVDNVQMNAMFAYAGYENTSVRV